VRRGRAAGLFALAGLAAAAVHVLTETPGELRDWRQTAPLAAALGAGLGAAARPATARAGALAAVVAGLAFAAVFAAGHGMIERDAAAVGPAFVRALGALGGPVGLGAVVFGAAAGWAAGRGGPSSATGS
jgi:hypothetical protein